MVRFSWHVEDGLSAYLPPNAYVIHKDSSVRHATCEIEVPNTRETLDAVFTLPADYLNVEKLKQTGIILGHGNNASEWKGKLLTEVAVFLACHGFVVTRFCCKQKEQRRQRMYEKALDACATSPFARGISKWVLAGIGSGARVAAVVGSHCRGSIAGFVMLSYPLKEVVPLPAKARRHDEDLPPPPKSSDSPLLNLEQPILFLMGSSDEFCSPADLSETVARMSSPEVRVEIFEEANQDFKSSSQGRGPAMSVVRRLCTSILDFITALDEDTLATCTLGKAADVLPAVEVKEKAADNPEGQQQAEATAPAEPAQTPAATAATHAPLPEPQQQLATQPLEAAPAQSAFAAPQAGPAPVQQPQPTPPAIASVPPAHNLYQQMLQNPQLLQALNNAQRTSAPQMQPSIWEQQSQQQQPQLHQPRPQQAPPTTSLHQILLQHVPQYNSAPPPAQLPHPGSLQLPILAGAPMGLGGLTSMGQVTGRPAPTGAQMLHGPPPMLHPQTLPPLLPLHGVPESAPASSAALNADAAQHSEAAQ